jgi:hypothetical protein
MMIEKTTLPAQAGDTTSASSATSGKIRVS